jgi:hypothetical protein
MPMTADDIRAVHMVCSWGEGPRIGLPAPDDDMAAVASYRDHQRTCDGRGCTVCALSVWACPECGDDIPFDVDPRWCHRWADDRVVAYGCEGYAMPATRAVVRPGWRPTVVAFGRSVDVTGWTVTDDGQALPTVVAHTAVGNVRIV